MCWSMKGSNLVFGPAIYPETMCGICGHRITNPPPAPPDLQRRAKRKKVLDRLEE